MVNLTIGGINVTKYLVQDSYSAPITAVTDSQGSFMAADGTANEPLLGFSQTVDFTLYRMDDTALSAIFEALYKPDLTVSFNFPVSRSVKCRCVSASPFLLRSAGVNLWQAQISLKCLELLRDSDGL